MKFRTPELFLGAFLAAAFFTMGMLFWSSHQPQPATHNQSQQSETAYQNIRGREPATSDSTAGGQERQQQEGKGEFWSAKLTDWLLAALTGLLVLFTYRLWKSTDRLWIAGEKQIGVAMKAAEAAELSANAAIGLQLPIIRAEAPDIAIYGRDANAPKLDPDAPDIEYRIYRVVYINRGNSIAYPKEYGICWLMTERSHSGKEDLPEIPDYDWVNPVDSDVTFKERFTADFFRTFRLRPDAERHKAIMSGSVILRVCAYLKYDDFLDRPHEARFCWRYVLSERGKRNSGFQTDDRVPENYTRKT